MIKNYYGGIKMANATLTTSGQQITPEQAQAAQAQSQAIAQAKAQIIAAVPGAIEKDGTEHQKLTKALPSKDRQKAYARMRQKASKNGGQYNLGNGQSVDVEQYIQQIEQANANGVPVKVNGAGTKGSVFLFQPTGEMQLAAEKRQEEEKKGFWQWCKDNWYWLALGAVAIGVGVYFLVRKKNKKRITVKTNKEGTNIGDTSLNNKNDPLSEETIKNNNLNGTHGDGSTSVDLTSKLENGSIKVEQDIGVGSDQNKYSDAYWDNDFWGSLKNNNRI